MKRHHIIQTDKRRGTYFVNIRCDGIRRYFPLGTNKRTAKRNLVHLEKDITAGKISFAQPPAPATTTAHEDNDLSLAELINQHLAWCKVNRSTGTYRNRVNYVLQFLDFAGKEIMVSEITRSTLTQYYCWAREHRSRSENGGNEALANIKALFKWGEEEELIILPFKRFPRMIHAPPPLKRLDDVTLLRLLGGANSDLRDLLLFGILTGLRPAELRNLNQSHIAHNIEGTTYISIERHKTSKTSHTYTPRVVPLCSEAERILERQMKAHPQTTTIFVNADGGPYTNWALRNKLRRLCTRLGIPPITPYALRHTFASRQSDTGIETTALANLMGHTTTRVLHRYVKSSFNAHKRAVEKLENGLRNIIQPLSGDGNETAKSEPSSSHDVLPIMLPKPNATEQAVVI